VHILLQHALISFFLFVALIITFNHLYLVVYSDSEKVDGIHQNRVTHIITSDIPQYFAIVTRLRQDSGNIGLEGGVLSSTVIPEVQALFPVGALTKTITVGLQVQADKLPVL